ncbi:PCNA-interacting partner [Leptosomus discolor]|uniref:PCNA-interacting partner n=1 Tax=Leptosomus discolor TaxID=188344 RepID=A0A091Q755_LEPDC|nr:PCNA-interacting partner [Leptosomus discolor]
MTAFQQKILNLIKCFRRQWPLFSNSERTTVCGADCMLMVLQLSMAEVNKEHHGDFTVSLSDVLETWKYLLHDKLGLSYENMKEPENYTDLKKAYHASLARSSMLDLIDVYQKCCGLGLLSEDESLAPVQLLEFISGIMNVQENNGSLPAPSTPLNRQGQEDVKVAVLAKKFICSYLSVLVNSKDDLALAHILNVPDRGLGREAFTNLKHASQKRKMSIFLIATSFIRTIELGGRGCASSLFDPLKIHVKGLSNFVNFIDKLQEIVGEISNPRIAGGRILSTVKMHLIKGRSNGDPFCQAVEEVVQDLDLKIKNIIDSQHEVLTASTTGVSPARVMGLLLFFILFSFTRKRMYFACFKSCCIVNTFTLKQLQRLSVVWHVFFLNVIGDNLSYMRHYFPPIGNVTVVLVLKRICGLRTLTNLGMLEVHCNFTVYSNPSKEKSSTKQKKIPVCLSHVTYYLQIRQSSIKSQFACTYKNELREIKGQQLFSSSQIPTCMHSAPEQHSEAGDLTKGMNSCLDVPVPGTISENVHQTRSYTEMGKLSCQPRNKNSKNEQMDLNNDKVICDKESEPSLQKNAKRPKTSDNPQKELDSKIGRKRKQSKTASKNKLIAGQAKLSHFFRL